MKITSNQPQSRRVDIEASLPRTDRGIMDATATAEWQGPVTCVNLKPGRQPGRLVPVEDFEALANVGAGTEPILCWDHPEKGRCLLMRTGNALTIVAGSDGGRDTTECHTIAPLPSRPLCAVAEGDGSHVVVMTAPKVYKLHTDNTENRWLINEAHPVFPTVMIRAGSFSTLTSEIAEANLKGSYTSTSQRLTDVDSKALRNDLTASMEEIENMARAAGRCIAPLLVRYRLRDENGHTLFLSPVTLVGTDKGYQLSDELNTSIEGGRRSGSTLRVESFKPLLKLPEEIYDNTAKQIKQLEVEAVGPLHGVDTDGIVWNRIDAKNSTLRFFMPGIASTMTSDKGHLTDIVLRALARFDQLSEKVASISNPFSKENLGRETAISIPGAGRKASDLAKGLRNALIKRQKARPVHKTTLAGGGWTTASFTADTVANNGDTTLWGNVNVLPFEQWGAGHYSTDSLDAKSWTATVSVEQKEKRAVCNSSGYTNAPLQLSPLIVWPGEDGGTMTLKVKTSTGTAIEIFELMPLAGCGISVWLSPTLLPQKLSYSNDNEFTVQASTASLKRMTGSIISTNAACCLEPAGMMSSPGNRITGITTATALSSAWDFSRDRFYVFGEGGINLCVTNANHEPVAMQLLDGRAVTCRMAIASGTADRGVAAIAGGCAVNVKGSKVTDFPGITPATARGIGWAGGDLWIMLDGGKAQVRPSEAPDHFYLRDTPTVESSLSCGDGRLRIVDREGILRDSHHLTYNEKEVEWSCRAEIPGYMPTPTRGTLGSVLRITAIGLAMVASAVKARLTATTDGGAASIALVRLLLSAMISGPMRESLFLPVNSGRRHWFTSGLKGVVSPDMRLRGVSLHLK